MATEPTNPVGEPTPSDVVASEARHLILIARDLRNAGDVPLVSLSPEGVTDEALTLAGELELIAMRLDMDAVMSMQPPKEN